jgi:hypothetical protein
MAVVKNKTSERNREFWSHVESVAKQVRCDPDTGPASSRSHIDSAQQEPGNSTDVSGRGLGTK